MSLGLNSEITPEIFEEVRDKNETIYWIGKPNAFCFMLSGIPILIIGLAWGSFDYYFLMQSLKTRDALGFIIPFLALHAFPCWGSLLYMGWLWLAHNKTFYGFSNRRLMIKTGAIGTDIKSFDYPKITNLEVTVGPIERMFGVGSIRFNTGSFNSRGMAMSSCFKAVHQPYEVFKKIKEVTVDIRTDENYPNAMRPAANAGYQTKYNPGDDSKS